MFFFSFFIVRLVRGDALGGFYLFASGLTQTSSSLRSIGLGMYRMRITSVFAAQVAMV
jgi:hypothetical protein